jgi:hypothetical protein
MIVHNETNHDNHHSFDSFDNELMHSYTFIIFANRTYKAYLDGRKAIGGYFNADFESG